MVPAPPMLLEVRIEGQGRWSLLILRMRFEDWVTESGAVEVLRKGCGADVSLMLRFYQQRFNSIYSQTSIYVLNWSKMVVLIAKST
jgi:hypothetical protein